MKYVLTIVLLLGIGYQGISGGNLYITGNIDWFQSGMHYKTIVVSTGRYEFREPDCINTVNITLDSLQCLKLQKDLRNGSK